MSTITTERSIITIHPANSGSQLVESSSAETTSANKVISEHTSPAIYQRHSTDSTDQSIGFSCALVEEEQQVPILIEEYCPYGDYPCRREHNPPQVLPTNDPANSSDMELKTIHPVLKSFMIGSVSGTCSTILFQPLDLLKTRLQTQPHRFTHGAHQPGLLPLMAHILRHEKLLGLWKGMTPSLTRCVPGVGLYFASIHGLKIALDIGSEPSGMEAVFLGVTGRTFSGIMMMPFTVVKTRYESGVYQYGSIREALRSIYGKEGVRGLTCGLIPTLLRDAPFSGLYLLMYTWTKRWAGRDALESPTYGPYVRFSCGVVAGVGASLVTQPADVIKTKMQLYPHKFTSVGQVVVYVYQKYGSSGYFKGLIPRTLRRTLIAAMSWTVYEQLVQSMGLK